MRISSLTMAMALACGTCAAADGALDGTFGNYISGVSKVSFGSGSAIDKGTAVLVQPDGKLVLVGIVGIPPGEKIAVARLMPAGTLDAGFGMAGSIEYAPPLMNATAYGAALQADGKIVTAGWQDPIIEGPTVFLVCRFSTSGALDMQFGDSGCARVAFGLGGNNDKAYAIVIDKSSRIVVGGFATKSVDSGGDFAFARLNTDGTPDSSFGFGGTGRQVVTRFDTLAGVATHDYIRSLAIQADGKIIGVGASMPNTNISRDFAVARLDSFGQLDPQYGDNGVRTIAFDLGGSKDDEASSAVLQSDGKLLVAGFATWTETDNDYAIARLDANGDPDQDFSGTGKLYVGFDLGGLGHDSAEGIALQSDGKILVAGTSHNSASGGVYGDDITICRLQTNGWLDNTFGTTGRVSLGLNLDDSNNDRAHALALQGGRPIIAGSVELPPSGHYAFVALRLSNALIFTNGFDP